MCKDVRSSVSAGLLSWVVAGLLWRRDRPGDRWLAAFLATFSTVQFVDAGVWWAGPRSDAAQVLTRYVLPVVLVAEVAVNYAGMRSTTGRRLPVFEVFAAVACVVFLVSWVRGCGGRTTVTRDGWLKWCGTDVSWVGRVAFLLLLAVPLLWFPDPLTRAVVVGGGALAWAVAARSEAFGSRWCHASNALSIFVLVDLLARRR